ncbi:MAG: hypothetical protein J0H89_04785 [Rhizobiales bacterium]|nr:hypothetical protein [Hyphomicrobiales bacterium]
MIIDGIDDHSHDSALRRSDLIPDPVGKDEIPLILKGRLVKKYRRVARDGSGAKRGIFGEAGSSGAGQEGIIGMTDRSLFAECKTRATVGRAAMPGQAAGLVGTV